MVLLGRVFKFLARTRSAFYHFPDGPTELRSLADGTGGMTRHAVLYYVSVGVAQLR